jgi:dTDP-4-dehydrorhamnose 3,5-epimerase-like enzyme
MKDVAKKPEMLDIPTNIDDRGYLWQLFEGSHVKRVYVVGNFDTDVVRGFHLHRKESKWFFVPRGSAKFVTVDEQTKETSTFILSDRKPAVLFVPPGNYNGWRALEDGTLLIGMSNKTLEESKGDDIRADPLAFGNVWLIKNR